MFGEAVVGLVSHRRGRIEYPVDFKLHHYQIVRIVDVITGQGGKIAGTKSFQSWKTLRKKRTISAKARSVASGSKRGPSSRVKACSAA